MSKVKKKLLYIDHSFHNKTKSAQFLEDILRRVYEVEVCCLDPCNDCEKELEYFGGQEFDVLVLFQVMPNIEKLKKYIRAKHFVFFPMFDGSGELGYEFWEHYKEFNIINFSWTLHEKLLCLGLSSYYIQYFPKPSESFKCGDSTNVFFWQRVSELNIDMVVKLLKKITISKIHVHKALDPFQEFKEPSEKLSVEIKYSNWYKTREEMLGDVESCAIYMAPRPYEGIGMSFLEAMAMGRCVIAPDFPTMNEYIVHGSNGLLYDFYLLKAIEVDDVERIQKNAFDYIKKGYAQWEKDKYKILDWLEAPLGSNKSSILKKNSQYMNVRTYYLFGSIPFLTIKDKPYKRYYYLLNFLYVLKSKRKSDQGVFYLFGFIPIWRIG